ncbi:hypothetical protein MKW94_023910 [Papaver nudicaule]|uniref:NADH dehydrogenase [ubiquinone] 1 alpha subcomplex assembly factor 4 n=1 Tax=Papaver nudicaule TaxID=74823 RepID=A0AA42AYW3_PAPNU|nr:hypothetical protein [Papaver nudicaule]
MGQALRRSAGKIRSSSLEPSAPSVTSQIKNVEKPPISIPIEEKVISNKGEEGGIVDHDSVAESSMKTENVFEEEEKDSGYDAMLSQMVGRIKTKPGGKLEMGEAFVVEKYNRPMPKLRNTTIESGRFEEKVVPPGTLNVTQIRHILQLRQGKAEDYNGHMDINQIAENFRVDTAQLLKIFQFVSLPPEDINKDNMQEAD